MKQIKCTHWENSHLFTKAYCYALATLDADLRKAAKKAGVEIFRV